jgi:hypothetical protein
MFGQMGGEDGGGGPSQRHTLPPQPQCNAGRPQARRCRYGLALTSPKSMLVVSSTIVFYSLDVRAAILAETCGVQI